MMLPPAGAVDPTIRHRAMWTPRTALASFGLTPPDAAADIRSTDTVLADVLVGDDGLARAVRFVRSGP